jgi:hypothetical protein
MRGSSPRMTKQQMPPCPEYSLEKAARVRGLSTTRDQRYFLSLPANRSRMLPGTGKP